MTENDTKHSQQETRYQTVTDGRSQPQPQSVPENGLLHTQTWLDTYTSFKDTDFYAKCAKQICGVLNRTFSDTGPCWVCTLFQCSHCCKLPFDALLLVRGALAHLSACGIHKARFDIIVNSIQHLCSLLVSMSIPLQHLQDQKQDANTSKLTCCICRANACDTCSFIPLHPVLGCKNILSHCFSCLPHVSITQTCLHVLDLLLIDPDMYDRTVAKKINPTKVIAPLVILTRLSIRQWSSMADALRKSIVESDAQVNDDYHHHHSKQDAKKEDEYPCDVKFVCLCEHESKLCCTWFCYSLQVCKTNKMAHEYRQRVLRSCKLHRRRYLHPEAIEQPVCELDGARTPQRQHLHFYMLTDYGKQCRRQCRTSHHSSTIDE